ncbi:hypothetical protein GOV07_03605 [Candidatus Woesearchaeota archaeon]|nr:hypothetical protein [Candidatus Woesearchaeota archaeon]
MKALILLGMALLLLTPVMAISASEAGQIAYEAFERGYVAEVKEAVVPYMGRTTLAYQVALADHEENKVMLVFVKQDTGEILRHRVRLLYT